MTVIISQTAEYTNVQLNREVYKPLERNGGYPLIVVTL